VNKDSPCKISYISYLIVRILTPLLFRVSEENCYSKFLQAISNSSESICRLILNFSSLQQTLLNLNFCRLLVRRRTILPLLLSHPIQWSTLLRWTLCYEVLDALYYQRYYILTITCSDVLLDVIWPYRPPTIFGSESQ